MDLTKCAACTASTGRVIALAGNPNVGKSTVFNALTGLKQHTGNWPGKTVANAQGSYRYRNAEYTLVDVPGTYSLLASSPEEEIARDFLCFGDPDAVVIVADATCLERNLNLVLQILEARQQVVLCVNLLDEAKKKRLTLDLSALSRKLGIPVVGASARSGRGLQELMEAVAGAVSAPRDAAFCVQYPAPIERAIAQLSPLIAPYLPPRLSARWVALQLLDADPSLHRALSEYLGHDLRTLPEIANALAALRDTLPAEDALRDCVVSSIVSAASDLYRQSVTAETARYDLRDRRLDRIFTSRAAGIPSMLLLLGAVFWLTIVGANTPSSWLSQGFFWAEAKLDALVCALHAPEWLRGVLVSGMFRTLGWVVSVMLPPMAIFFPLFTLLEDSGYLPRVAFNLDRFFKKACAHGKQALTMCMGLGCNACGVTGCRIIDSPRERLIAILTNNFVPCNGRFAQPHKGQQIYRQELTAKKKPLNLLCHLMIFPIALIKSKHIERNISLRKRS